MIRLVPRPAPSQGWSIAAPILAVIASMIMGGVLFAFLGIDPIAAIQTIFWDPLFGATSGYSRPQLLIKAGPLILIACGLALGFRAGIWNIGAEGQYIMGALGGAAVALAAYPSDSVLIFPAMIAAGALSGWAWGMIPALLRIRFGASEILVSLMLVYVAEGIAKWVSFGPMKNPDGFGMPGSRNLQQYPAAANPEIFPGTGAHWGTVAAALAVVVVWWIIAKSKRGFDIRVAGLAPRAARFAGVKPGRLIAFCLGIAGAFAGLAGVFEAAGPAGQITDGIGVGYGFTAIIVAYLGRLHPVGILLAGLLLALTYIGGEVAQMTLGLPAATVQVFQGMLLFFLLGFDLLTSHSIERSPR